MGGIGCMQHRDVDIQKIEYLRHDGKPLLARVSKPRGRGPFPSVVEMHGGAWCVGARNNNEAINRPVAGGGAVIAALDFRAPPEARDRAAKNWPRCFQQSARDLCADGLTSVSTQLPHWRCRPTVLTIFSHSSRSLRMNSAMESGVPASLLVKPKESRRCWYSGLRTMGSSSRCMR